MHQRAPFTLNDHSLITEKAGKAQNGMYTESGKSWLINPLIAHAVLIKQEAALFFAPLPTNHLLQAVGHKLRDLDLHIRAVRELINSMTCQVYTQDIERLQGYNFLYFSPALQNRVITALEYHHSSLAEGLLVFSMEKFKWEREIFMLNQQQRAKAFLPPPPPKKAPPPPPPCQGLPPTPKGSPTSTTACTCTLSQSSKEGEITRG